MKFYLIAIPVVFLSSSISAFAFTRVPDSGSSIALLGSAIAGISVLRCRFKK